MIDNIYRNAFKEVYDILQNTEDELVEKIPDRFINFIKENMNVDYKTDIREDIEIDKQKLLKETEAILSLIYRSYWATNEEKKEFAIKDEQEYKGKKEKEEYQGKDIYEIFEKRKNINKVTLDNNLMVIEKESFIKKIFNKILSIIHKRR